MGSSCYRTGFKLLILWLFSIGVATAAPINVHLKRVSDLLLSLREPGFFHLSTNYPIVQAMQRECNEAERHYGLDYTLPEGKTLVEDTARLHVLMATGAALIGGNLEMVLR